MRTYRLKIGVLGEQAVGKTSAVRAFSELAFEERYLESGDVRVWDALLPPAEPRHKQSRHNELKIRAKSNESDVDFEDPNHSSKSSRGRNYNQGFEGEDYNSTTSSDRRGGSYAEFEDRDVGFELSEFEEEEPRVRAQFWDCGTRVLDQNRLERMLDGALCALIMYDVTDFNSYDRATMYWLDVVRNVAPDTFVVLVGCKVDQSSVRAVDVAEIEDFAKTHGVMFMEMSARTGENVDLTLSLLRIRAQHMVNAEIHATSLDLDAEDNRDRSPVDEQSVERQSYSELGNATQLTEKQGHLPINRLKGVRTDSFARASRHSQQPLSTCEFDQEFSPGDANAEKEGARNIMRGEHMGYGGNTSVNSHSLAQNKLEKNLTNHIDHQPSTANPMNESPDSMTISAILGRQTAVRSASQSTFGVQSMASEDDTEREALVRDIQNLNVNSGLVDSGLYEKSMPGEGTYSIETGLQQESSLSSPQRFRLTSEASADEWSSARGLESTVSKAREDVGRLSNFVKGALENDTNRLLHRSPDQNKTQLNNRGRSINGQARSRGGTDNSFVSSNGNGISGIRLHHDGGLSVQESSQHNNQSNQSIVDNSNKSLQDARNHNQGVEGHTDSVRLHSGSDAMSSAKKGDYTNKSPERNKLFSRAPETQFDKRTREQRGSTVSAPAAERRFIRPEDTTLHKRSTQSFARKAERDEDDVSQKQVPRRSRGFSGNSRSTASETVAPEMYVDVNMDGKLIGTIPVHRGDDPVALASAFVLKHRLDRSMQPKLRRLLHDRMIEFHGSENQPLPFHSNREGDALSQVSNIGSNKSFRKPRNLSRSSFRSNSGPIIGTLHVKVGPGRIGKLVVREGDDPGKLVAGFRKTYGLRERQASEIEERVVLQLRLYYEQQQQESATLRPTSLHPSPTSNQGEQPERFYGHVDDRMVENNSYLRERNSFGDEKEQHSKISVDASPSEYQQIRHQSVSHQLPTIRTNHLDRPAPYFEPTEKLPSPIMYPSVLTQRQRELLHATLGWQASRDAASAAAAGNQHSLDQSENGHTHGLWREESGTTADRPEVMNTQNPFESMEQTYFQTSTTNSTSDHNIQNSRRQRQDFDLGQPSESETGQPSRPRRRPPPSLHEEAVLRAATSPQNRSQPLFHLDVNIGKGHMERISVREGDDVAMLAQSFAERHGLSFNKVPRLTFLLEEKLLLHSRQNHSFT
mmetsp:Transcript_5110/g.10604  ORF Transcript_5110/g.10604 Transcript_5110/m.10604 type:complete len:1204 (-) Transcript_5110:288-3899(-)|eukprot:CAMPEP_0171569698 /NCGR_PEP_ID=MMETSP0961-20121227/2504_1 /TAXON_ID=87120 /ORGANISM="Aurantiochytrium limacinum, Strain ATCCMYA-1381" /LENGTH=1203 /DNA_ID=CAMNT_0012124047 /DNA_START=133 /DNA_END=3744 /DNA_ORIENTATION=+